MKINPKGIRSICFTALFAAIICVCTFISVPLPIGYFNLGDAAVLLCAWTLGPLCGAIASAIGSALADVFIGYVLYAPATAVIKALMAVCAYFLSAVLLRIIKKPSLAFVPRAISAIAAEMIMISGYFIYEFAVLSYGPGAAASLLGNTLQAVCGAVIGTTVAAILHKRFIKHNT